MKNAFRLDNSRIPCLGPVHPSASLLKFRRRHSLDYIGFDLVADLDVVEVLKTDTAFEDFAYFGLAENLFLLDLLENSNHRGFNFFLDLINDRMQANVDAFLFSQIT